MFQGGRHEKHQIHNAVRDNHHSGRNRNPTYAQDPAGQWRLDTVYPVGNDPRLLRNAQPGDDVRGWWWFPITNEKLLIDHMNQESMMLPTAWGQLLPRVYVFPGAGGGAMIPPVQPDTTGGAHGGPIVDVAPSAVPGIALIETDSSVVVVGGTTPYGVGSLKAYAKTYIKKPIRWLIIPDVMESSWAAALDFYTPGEQLTVITSKAFTNALSARQAVAPNDWTSSTGARRVRVAGGFPILPAAQRLPRDLDWRVSPPSDDFLAYGFSGRSPPCPRPSGYTDLRCRPILGEEETLIR